eukprot:1175762-Prorocentrum_minimum.AAC.1
MPALPAYDWSVVRIKPHFLRQERHDASHGRHLNDSLRRIFNRNANTPKRDAKKEEPKKKDAQAKRPKAICNKPEVGSESAVVEQSVLERNPERASEHHDEDDEDDDQADCGWREVVRDVSITEKTKSSIFEVPVFIEAGGKVAEGKLPSKSATSSAVVVEDRDSSRGLVVPTGAIGGLGRNRTNRVTPIA